MANRYVAYGYEITDGRIATIESEREIVVNIFGMYMNGHGMAEIANRMNQAGISYKNDGRSWNKNIIKRILENRKYLGDGKFPQIIPQDTFDRTEKMILAKSTKSDDIQKEINDLFRTTLVCACCGEKLDRYKGSKHNRRFANYRRCKNPECTNPATSVREDELKEIISGIVNELIRNPEKIKAEKCKPMSTEEGELDINFAEELNNPRNEIKDIVAEITRAAELRFDQCIEQDFTAIDKNIRKELSIRAEKPELDIKLIKSITKIMRLHPNKVVEMELINGNKFTGGIDNDNDTNR